MGEIWRRSKLSLRCLYWKLNTALTASRLLEAALLSRAIDHYLSLRAIHASLPSYKYLHSELCITCLLFAISPWVLFFGIVYWALTC